MEYFCQRMTKNCTHNSEYQFQNCVPCNHVVDKTTEHSQAFSDFMGNSPSYPM